MNCFLLLQLAGDLLLVEQNILMNFALYVLNSYNTKRAGFSLLQSRLYSSMISASIVVLLSKPPTITFKRIQQIVDFNKRTIINNLRRSVVKQRGIGLLQIEAAIL